MRENKQNLDRIQVDSFEDKPCIKDLYTILACAVPCRIVAFAPEPLLILQLYAVTS